MADFGFVTPLPTNVGSTAVVTARGAIDLASTRGYTSPEYADGKRKPKTDVYMYGVVSTGQHPNVLQVYCILTQLSPFLTVVCSGGLFLNMHNYDIK